MEAEKPKKAHKKKHAGVKAKKKKEKGTGKVDKHNPRAHTFSGGAQSVAKRVRYSLEKAAKKDRAPKVDKTPEVPPPFIVVVQGPPGVGKTTLIQSLVKHYARQKLVQQGGPITLVSSRARRLTIVECPQEMSAMLDLAKVADLVILMIDASFGFELETFEFINILQVHGFPRIIGVLTKLDCFKENKQLRKTKKAMKHRFWSEVYEGAKLFHFSGLQYGRYHRNEVQNLARFIAIAKVPLLSWRQSHPYMLVLRWEDQTDPAAAREAPRHLELYGYVYGGRLREGTQAHLAGVGDFAITNVKSLPDPCPHPTEVEAERNRAQGKKTKKQNALRSLAERHRVIYAPGSEVGSITVDSDAMYIHLPETQVGFTERDGDTADGELPEAVKLVRAMQGSEGALDRAVAARPGLKLLSGSTVRLPEVGGELTEAPGESRSRRRAPDLEASVPGLRTLGGEDGEDEEADGGENADDEDGEESQGEDGDEAGDSDAEAHRQDVLETARRRFGRVARLEELIYGGGPVAASATRDAAEAAAASGSNKPTDHKAMPLFDDDDDAAQAPQKERHGATLSGLLGNMGDLDGVDTARMPLLPGESNVMDEEAREALKDRKFITGGWSSAEEDEVDEDGEAKKAQGDKAADGAGEAVGGPESAVVNGSTAHLEGFSDGMPIATFVRIRLDDVPAACVAEFKRERPIILGGLLPGESRMGLMQVRLKRHRWHPKLLKSGDALLLSVGWRRFQTLPTFSLEDRGEKRMRYLKYSLEHAHCTMTSYGPMMPPNTGVLAFRSWRKVGHFRVCGTGGVLESAPNFTIMKKLKLTGEPFKIFRNTAFVKNMFNSDLEVSKYLHTKIQTVSGIRGEVKKAEGSKGHFRATFEDRILMSDLVVCKCWINVQPKQFYHPVIDVPQWRPARLIGELRAAQGEPVPDKQDSKYGKQFVRAERKFNPLRVNKKLQDALPFSAKKRTKRIASGPLREKAAIVSSERDVAVNALLERLKTVRRMREKIKTQASAKKKAVKEAREKFIQDKRDLHTKEAKKNKYREEGKRQQEKRKAMRMD